MPYTTKIIPLQDALQDYSSAWQELVKLEAVEPTQMPGWIEATCKAFDVYQLIDVWCAFDEQDKLISIIPFQRKNTSIYGLPVNCIELVTNIISYHARITGLSKHPDIFQLFLKSIERWDMCVAPNLLKGDTTYQTLIKGISNQSQFAQEITALGSPYLPITTDWDGFLQQRSRSFRYRIQRKAKAVAKAGEISMRWFTDEQDIDQLLAEILKIEANSWKVEAGMAISHRPVEERYYQELLPFMAKNGLLMANVMYINQTPAAYGLCYNFKQCWGQLKTSFDNHYKEFSPGKHLVDLTIEQAFKSGAQEFDFLGDRMRHKLEWTDHVREHNSLYIYNSKTLKGKLAILAKRLTTMLKSFKKTETP